MKRDWIKKVKNNTVVNGIVRLGIGTVLAIAKVCIPVNEKKILFVSFNGLRYDDSPRVLYETCLLYTSYSYIRNSCLCAGQG